MPRRRALARLQVIKVTPNISGGSDANAPAFSWRQVTASFLPLSLCVFAFFFFKDITPHPLHILLCSEQCTLHRWHRRGRQTAQTNCSSWPRAAGTAGQRVEPRPGEPQIILRPASVPVPNSLQLLSHRACGQHAQGRGKPEKMGTCPKTRLFTKTSIFTLPYVGRP